MRRAASSLLALLVAASLLSAAQQPASLPARPDSLKFAVIGDSGTGDTQQYEVGRQMVTARARFPFEMVIMLGDNMYGRQDPQDFVTKFERPYSALLGAGVIFYASLGNHDNQNNRFYKGFNMGGERYYTYVKKNVRFFVLDSNQMDPRQRVWLEDSLKQAREDWKVCYFHHPLYADGGRHGSDVALRVALEPLLTRYGVNVVFAGHDHIYERLAPQKGIAYFVEGASGELRRGDTKGSAMNAAHFDQDQSFMLVEVGDDELFFETVARTGGVVDSGVIHRQGKT
jgi:Calcineurin-like phosphoesterase